MIQNFNIYITLNSYFLSFMFPILLLNRCVVINSAKILFTSQIFRKIKLEV